ncbi:cupin domain-containing protein [Pseudoalteromonas sp. SSM20]|uniref:AraC family transcriptional regulator n=1 Tax=Pseudoalteromonas sp. SSM20 TaxID=3139394 RepID=UPI003BAC357F
MLYLFKNMSENPNIYLNDPDPLSVLLKRLSLNAEVYVNGDFCGTWAVDTSGSRRIPFHLIGRGEAWLHMGDEKHKLETRDLVIFPKDHQHIISNNDNKPSAELVNAPMSNDGDTTNMVCGFFEFKNAMVNPLLDALPDVIHLPAKDANGNTSLKLIDLMILELQHARAGCYTVVDQLAYLLFIEVLRGQVASGELNSGLLLALFDARIGKALNAIHQAPENAWNLEQLAGIAAMSRSNFADKFTKMVGSSPVKYLVIWRMLIARKLLITTDMSIADIAEKSGYDSEAAFRKAFKQNQGEAPGAVRNSAHVS